MSDIRVWHVRDKTYLSADSKLGEDWLTQNMLGDTDKTAAILTVRIDRDVSEEVIAAIKADCVTVEE